MHTRLIPAILLTFVNTLNFSVMIPILPFLVQRLNGSPILYGIILSLYPVCQFVATPILGSLSDRLGRRPVLLVSQAGTTLSWIIFLGAVLIPSTTTYQITLSIILIGCARILDGITGGNASVANAYVSDVTKPGEKAAAFGLMGATVGIGFMIGPMLGGILMGSQNNYIAPTVLTLGISIVTLLWIMVRVPESLPTNKRIAHSPISLTAEFDFLKKILLFHRKYRIAPLLGVRFIYFFVFTSFSAIFVLYLVDRFRFSPEGIGYFFMFIGISMVINQGVFSKLLIKKLGELRTFILGGIIVSLLLTLLVLPAPLWLFFMMIYVQNLGYSVSMPSFKAILSGSVSETDQGAIMGIDESIFAGTSAISPILSATMYALIGGYYFSLQGVILGMTMLLFAYALRLKAPQRSSHTV